MASFSNKALSIGTTPKDSQTKPPPKLDKPATNSGDNPNATQQAAMEIKL